MSNKKTNKKIRFAAVGLGHITQAAFLPAFKKSKLPATLAALVSGDKKKLTKLSKTYKVENTCGYSDYADLLKSGEVDAVYIGLPNTMHYEYAMHALDNGIHVLCEKPLCPGVRECENLIRMANKKNLKLMVGYRLHLDPLNLEVTELIKRGVIGEPLLFNSLFSYQIKDQNIRLESDLGGGALYDIGIYCINAARYIFKEEPHAVFGNLVKSQDRRFKEVDGTVSATLLFSEGKTAVFSASFAAYERSVYEVVGTKGSIRVEPAYEYSEGLGFVIETKKGKKAFKHKKHDQFAAQIEYFAEAINKNKKIEPNGEEGLADIRIIEAIFRSDKEGKLIKLDEFETDYPSMEQSIKFNGTAKAPLVNVESASG